VFGGLSIGAQPEGYGLSLPGVYLAWMLVVAALYLPCRWFADVKRRRADVWLSYL
jgi:cytochrome bd-type quinol oxidase subunit 2